jgi:hypothetical protein
MYLLELASDDDTHEGELYPYKLFFKQDDARACGIQALADTIQQYINNFEAAISRGNVLFTDEQRTSFVHTADQYRQQKEFIAWDGDVLNFTMYNHPEAKQDITYLFAVIKEMVPE